MHLKLLSISTLLTLVLTSKLATYCAARQHVVSDNHGETEPALQERGLQRICSSVRATARKSLRALVRTMRVIAFSEVAALLVPDLSLGLATIVWQTSMDRCLISSRLASRQGIAGAPCTGFHAPDIRSARIVSRTKQRTSISGKVANGENHAV